MSDLRDPNATPWHQAGDLADEVERLRDTVAALRLELDRVRDQRDEEAAGRKVNADALWKASGEAQRLRVAIRRHRDRCAIGTSVDAELWKELDDA